MNEVSNKYKAFKKRGYLRIFCFFIVTSLAAQNSVVFKNLLKDTDSLLLLKKYDKALLLCKEALHISLKEGFVNDIALTYKKLGFIAGKQKKYRTSQHYYLRSLKYDSTTLLAADCYHNIALIKRKINEKDSVIYYLKKATSLYDKKSEADNDAAGNVYMNAGRIFKDRQQYQTALNYLLKAYQKFNDVGAIKKLAATCSSIAHIHKDLNNSDKAFQYYYESLSLRLKTKDTIAISMSYNNLANAFKKEKEIDSAIFYYRKSLVLKTSKSSPTAKSLYNIGICYYLKGQKDSARFYYKESLKIHKKRKDSLETGRIYNELALIELSKNSLDNSKRYLDLSDQYLKNTSYKKDAYRNYEIKSLYYEKLGNFKEAHRFQKKYIELYISVFNEEQVALVQLFQERFESEQRKAENLQLSLLNKEKQALIELQKSKLWVNQLFVFVLGLTVLFLLAGYFWIRQRQIIYRQKQKLEKMDAIFKGQETIKKSIGKDLHDIITTNFDGLRLKILALPKSKNIKGLSDKIAEEIKSVNAQIRLISHRLSPLDDKIKRYKLTTIINSQLSEFQMYRKIFVHLDTDIPDELNHIGLDAQTNFYGIFLEALNNIEKHSKATEIKVSFQVSETNDLIMKIKDNGIGFKKKNSNGVGILNITQRAELLKGICTIKGTEEGTEIHLSFPLKT
jgi:two-component system NarL family sensor kinase